MINDQHSKWHNRIIVAFNAFEFEQDVRTLRSDQRAAAIEAPAAGRGGGIKEAPSLSNEHSTPALVSKIQI